MLAALALCFVATVLTRRFEFGLMSLLFTFNSFIAVVRDTTIPDDMSMLFYVPIIGMGLFSVAAFFKVKVE